MTHQERHTQALGTYAAGLARVKATPPPKGQKYPPGTRVRIRKPHYENEEFATVRYTYAHAYGGDDVKSYCLDVDGRGAISWFSEEELIYDRENSNTAISQ